MDIVKPKSPQRLLSRRNLLRAAAAAAVLIATGVLINLGRAVPSTARSGLWIDTAQHGEMRREIRASGTLIPRDVRWITAGTTANVHEVLVQPGAKVTAQTVIARLTNPSVQSNLQRAQASLVGAQADVAARRTALESELLDQQAALAQAESAYHIARLKAEANTKAANIGVVSRVDAEQSQIIMLQNEKLVGLENKRVRAFQQNYDAQMQAAVAARDQATSALAIAQQDADALEVKAGIDGILQEVSIEPGQQVLAGASLARVARPDQLIARLLVPEAQAKDLTLELPVNIDTRNGIVAGALSRIDPAVRDGRVTIDVTFTQPLPSGARPDLSVEGRIVLDTLANVVSIGRPTLATPNGKSTLFVLKSDTDVAKRMAVTYGAASSDRIEVREGVSSGDRVILSDTSQWNQYDALRVR